MKASTYRKSRRGKGKRRRPSKRQSRKTSRKTNRRRRRSKSRRNSRRMRRKVGGTGENHKRIQLIADNINKLRFLNVTRKYNLNDKFKFKKTDDKLIFKLEKGTEISKLEKKEEKYGTDDTDNYLKIIKYKGPFIRYEIMKDMIIEINHTDENPLTPLVNKYNKTRNEYGMYSIVMCSLLEHTFYTICSTLYDEYKDQDQYKEFFDVVNDEMWAILHLNGIDQPKIT